jgi:hypothetical protein
LFDTPEILTTEFLPSVGVIDAILLFRRFGVDVTGMGADQVHAARRNLLHKHHPDRGGKLDTAQSINAAYDLIKSGVPKYRGTAFAFKTFRRAHPSRRAQVAALTLCYPDHPEWAWAGYSGHAPVHPTISHQDFTDVNFIKKSMWELSGRSENEYTLWGFDGHQFRGHLTVFGAPKIFNYMADAMITWHTKSSHHHCECRAVFVHEEETNNVYLIYSDRKYYGDDPVKMQCSCGRDPQEDQEFVRSLPAILDRLREVKAA